MDEIVDDFRYILREFQKWAIKCCPKKETGNSALKTLSVFFMITIPKWWKNTFQPWITKKIWPATEKTGEEIFEWVEENPSLSWLIASIMSCIICTIIGEWFLVFLSIISVLAAIITWAEGWEAVGYMISDFMAFSSRVYWKYLNKKPAFTLAMTGVFLSLLSVGLSMIATLLNWHEAAMILGMWGFAGFSGSIILYMLYKYFTKKTE